MPSFKSEKSRVIGAVLSLAVASPVFAYSQRDCGLSSSDRKSADCTSIIQGSGETTKNQDVAFHKVAYYLERDRGSAEYSETVGLDPRDPQSCNCGIRHQADSGLHSAIISYSQKIKRDPKDDNSFFRRGIAYFYVGSLAKALVDIGQANKLDPEYPYYALWLDIVERRSSLASRLPQTVPQINLAKWPAPVFSLFLGQMTPAAVLAAANDPDAVTTRGQVCEANFYSGEWALHQGARDEAIRLFRLAAADCPRDDFVEGPAANAELTALGWRP
jgi:lipoprotein NlpI